MTQDLVLAEPKQSSELAPQNLFRHATDIAGICKTFVLSATCNIKGKRHVLVEGWNAIATAHGCVSTIKEVQKLENGYLAKAALRRQSDGVEISEAQGFVGMDEADWAKRPEYACRAMAQTRAVGRVCKAAFAHVVLLIDSNLSTTPAEEVPIGGFEDASPAQPIARATVQAAPPAPPRPQQPTANVVFAPVTTTSDAPEIRGVVKKVATKPTAKGGTRYGILLETDGEGSGVWLNTFDDVSGGLARQLEGLTVTAKYRETKYGKDLVNGTLEEALL